MCRLLSFPVILVKPGNYCRLEIENVIKMILRNVIDNVTECYLIIDINIDGIPQKVQKVSFGQF